MAGIRDVAERAGVSVATVSRALRGLPRVSDETRERVRAAAVELGYVPSPTAASLASGRTSTVGVIVPWVTRWFFSSVVQGAQSVLADHGYDLLLYELGGRQEARDRLFGRLLHKRVDAVLVLSLPMTEAEQRALVALDRPVAMVGGCGSGFPGVGIDDIEAALTATRHLIELGHERIAFIGRPAPGADYPTQRDRHTGYRRALAEAGLRPNRALETLGDYTVAAGTEQMARLLGGRERPTAVFAACDEMAFGALHAARTAGVAVPDDLSVIGIDDHEMAPLLDLTTVAQPARYQGRIAAELLLHMLRGDGRWPDRPIVVPTQLVLRGTTAPFPPR
jgi:DNA-binding LacI/PurR family transcriptional regulator